MDFPVTKDITNASVTLNISPDVKKVTESSGEDESDYNEHRSLSDSESVELETKSAKIPGRNNIGEKNTPSESPQSGKIVKVKLPSEAKLKFSK